MQTTPLSEGNAALRNKDYEAAIRHYNRALAQTPELTLMLQSNIKLAHQLGGLPNPATAEAAVATIDIVVPVYNALEDVKKCLESLQRCTDGLIVKIIVVNDGSDEVTTQWLRKYCGGQPIFKLIENEKNVGYTKTVNTGLKATTADYVITQNSDTIVSPGWLTGLIRCMNSNPRIGIVGPLSNAANWQSVPNLRDEQGNFAVNELPAGYTVDDMASQVRNISTMNYPEFPFVNGFCFMIKRQVIEAIGLMDEENFLVGYGEENDYCIRATDNGFKLAIADDVFVFHAKSKSFGHNRRKELSRIGDEALRKKYGQKKYQSYIELLKISKELEHIRDNIKSVLNNKISQNFNQEKDQKFDDEIREIQHYDLKKIMQIISNSGLYDEKWYLAENLDVAKNKNIDPLSHFARNGGRERRDPGPNFKTSWYLENYPEVLNFEINPLIHYEIIGKRIGYKRSKEEVIKLWSSKIKVKNSLSENLNIYNTIRRIKKNQLPIAIIIPIYNAFEELQECIKSIQKHTKHSFRLILINDASTDIRVAPYLNSLVGIKSFEIYHNKINYGFTKTVNYGISLAGLSDVIFLNSDTRVTPNWLLNLRIAAYSDERVGTATPFSNNAGAYSAPEIGRENEIPANYNLDNWARAIAQATLRIYPKAPTGHGFCMYVRRDCLDDVGTLDDLAFPRGYGEENDFCMRAVRKGWHNIVDQSTYIYHVRSASFGDSKSQLLKQGREIIDKRYPEYTAEIRKFITQEDLVATHNWIKQILSTLLESKINVKPRVLYVLSTKTGGTPHTNQDLMQALGQEIETFVIYSNSKKIDLYIYHEREYTLIESCILNETINAFPHQSDEYDAVVSSWIVKYAFELVHVRHLAWHSLGLIDITKALGIPVVFSLHDFYTICPTVKLLDAEQKYCGGTCTSSLTECKYDLWRDEFLPPLKNAAIFEWRRTFESVLKKCDHLVTTSESAKSIVLRNFNVLKVYPFSVIPHGRDFENISCINKNIDHSKPLKILVPGNISKAKGGEIISGLAKYSEKLNIEIHLLGKVSGNVDVTNCILHGEYKRDEFVEKVRNINPHLAFVLSIWPETHCHTLTESWAAGLPVIGFNIGAVGERISKTKAGWLINNFNTEEVINLILEIKNDSKQYERVMSAVKSWQISDALNESCMKMAFEYKNIYNTLIG